MSAPSQPSASASAPAPAPVSVSVLGLGMMGSALAAALLNAGHRVTVWNRSAAKTGPLVAQGAMPAATPAEAVEASPLLIVCLLTNDNVTELLSSLGDTVSGKTLVNLTNGTPAQARELSAWAAKHDARYIDGGIMAVPQMIAGPDAFVFYSGDEEAFEAHRDTLAAFGGTKWEGSDPGLAALNDLALLTGMYGMFVGVLQAFALVRTENISAEKFSELLVPWITAMLAGAPELGRAVDTGQHLTDVSSLAVNQAAFPNFLATYRDQGVSPELFEPFQAILDRSIAEGHAADGLSRLADLLKAEHTR
ncbi:NAD(P)-binding domain-containing protein [Streptomyces sp. NPDC000410]|uniref:NAD(P)-dependent oxidoreductase n=1 Tax=Streptomyces sp. NPDC000410 TaxID=3154254 RepID=UPI00332B5673